jgi:adenylate cyclase
LQKAVFFNKILAMKIFSNLPKWVPGLLLSLFVTIITIVLYNFDALNKAENLANDIRFKIRGEKKLNTPVVFVAIDENSIANIGRWPWPRSVIGDLISKISEAEPKVIGLNILFTEPDSNQGLNEVLGLKERFLSNFVLKQSVYNKNKGIVTDFLNAMTTSEMMLDNDKAFADSLQYANDVVLPMFFGLTKPESKDYVEFVPEVLSKYSLINANKENPAERRTTLRGYAPLLLYDLFTVLVVGLGHANVIKESDGVIRRMYPVINYSNSYFLSFEFQLLKLYTGASPAEISFIPGHQLKIKDKMVPLEKDSSMLINFNCLPQTRVCYSVVDVLTDAVPPETFKDKIVVIGHRASGIATLESTPLSTTVPGIELIIDTLNTVLTGEYITKIGKMQEIFMMILIGVLMGVLITHFKPVGGVIFTAGIFVVYVIINYVLFAKFRISATIIYPSLLIFFSDLAVVLYKYATEEKEKKWIKGAFSTYVSASVVDKLMKNPETLALGGVQREMTVFFSDIAGFTTISESLSPTELVSFINEYLDSMTQLIFKHEGTLDKYIGDAIMAFWNAPADQADHALKGVKAALDCMEQLHVLQQKWSGEGKAPFNIRIGLNSGQMLVGNMGSTTKMNYTIMGDSVNLGSRLEAANKEYGTNIMMSEFTKAHVDKQIESRELDLITVKGKNKPIAVYEVLGMKGMLKPDKVKSVGLYMQGVACYKNKQWTEALDLFNKTLAVDPNDGPSKTYIKRCIEFQKNPPADDWDGVWRMKTK